MTKSVAQTLITHRTIDHQDLAKNFVRQYVKEPNRGYGGAVVTIFGKFRKNKFTDLVGPAQEQFNGT